MERITSDDDDILVHIEEQDDKHNKESNYVMLHKAYTESPCMSFDIIRDDMGYNRTAYPHTVYIVAGTEAARRCDNKILIMKWSNIHKTSKSEQDDEEESRGTSDEEIARNLSLKMPVTSCSTIDHYGCIKRLRNTEHYDTILTAASSETSLVSIFDLKDHLKAVDNESEVGADIYEKRKLHTANNHQMPLFSFYGHSEEGYALDWSPMVPGLLATGDSTGNMNVLAPQESTWRVFGPFKIHTDSVEDIQWSPYENGVLASCSVDKSIKIWDTRDPDNNGLGVLSVNAHTSDINSIHWNRLKPLIVSGGDDGIVNVWDLRMFKDDFPIAMFNYHAVEVLSVEWHPTESSIFASTDYDETYIWDLNGTRNDESHLKKEYLFQEIPSQLMFVHLDQDDVEELHWHPQIPGMVITTENNNFNIIKTTVI